MKIGILTYHAAYNFGANLQAYATANIIESKGHTAKIIDYRRLETRETYRNQVGVSEKQWAGHDLFILNRLPLTRHASDKQELVEIAKEEQFDAIIVGADAVWSFSKTLSDLPVYFCDWLFKTPEIANIPVASLSVANMSGGFRHVTSENLALLRECISKFSYLTVRDRWTQKAVNDHIFNGKNIINVISPDPVFTIDNFINDTWQHNDLIKTDDKFFLVTLPTNGVRYRKWIKEFIKEAHKLGYKVGELPVPEGVSQSQFDFTLPFPLDPIQWYLWIKHSSGFVGLRFHAIVSCVTTGIPFFSADSYGSRGLLATMLNRFQPFGIISCFDKKSKIYQLLEKTSFKNCRVNITGLLNVSPQIVVNKLLSENRIELIELRNQLIDDYNNKLDAMLEVFSNRQKHNEIFKQY